ncbi:MAG: hypothetical protein KAT32_02810 [Candidatus Moranbacteria bacterium]|nr:hypothetical protein [Candidatus Moranbacteria bacterium]
MKKSKMIVPALVLGVATIVGVSSFNNVSANEESQYSPIMQKVAEKFNLNQDEVKQVFDENREERRAENKAKADERLSKLVNEGKLTEDQKNVLIAKREEIRQERENSFGEMKDLSPEERKEKRQEHQEEMKKFFEEQGIDHDALMGDGGMRNDQKQGSGRGQGGGDRR